MADTHLQLGLMTRRADRVMLAGVIDYRLRPVEAGDSAALYDLRRAMMRTCIEEVYGPWDEDVQKAFHEAWMEHERAQVIEVRGRLVGVVDIEWRGDYLYLSRVELSPELQNLGLGAAIIEGLIDLGASRACALALDVFDVNPARRLYERHGFHAIGVRGQKVHMRRALSRMKFATGSGYGTSRWRCHVLRRPFPLRPHGHERNPTGLPN